MCQNNILIIANACFSQTDSNGRNLSRLVEKIPYNNKAEFFVYGCPDFQECGNYYRVTDSDALYSFIKRRRIDGRLQKKIISDENKLNNNKKKNKKTPLKMLLREMVWKYGKWENDYLYKWINDFSPDLILAVAGDNCFILDFARRLSIKKNLPLIIYSTEEYPFKNYNYVTRKISFCYFLWRNRIKKSYNLATKIAKCGIFNSELLANEYQKHYNLQTHFIYQKSNIDWIENYKLCCKLKISYLGNLGLNRHKALIELAIVLNNVFPGVKLDIYGKCSDNVKNELSNCPYISYNGFINYNQVIDVIHSSSLLIHTEYNDSFYIRDLKYAFSTKITDCVCSGTPLLIYAPLSLIETQFLSKNKCAFVASTRLELSEKLYLSLTNEKERKKVVNNSYIVRMKYFTNDLKFTNILEEIVNESITS